MTSPILDGAACAFHGHACSLSPVTAFLGLRSLTQVNVHVFERRIRAYTEHPVTRCFWLCREQGMHTESLFADTYLRSFKAAVFLLQCLGYDVDVRFIIFSHFRNLDISLIKGHQYRKLFESCRFANFDDAHYLPFGYEIVFLQDMAATGDLKRVRKTSVVCSMAWKKTAFSVQRDF